MKEQTQRKTVEELKTIYNDTDKWEEIWNDFKEEVIERVTQDYTSEQGIVARAQR